MSRKFDEDSRQRTQAKSLPIGHCKKQGLYTPWLCLYIFDFFIFFIRGVLWTLSFNPLNTRSFIGWNQYGSYTLEIGPTKWWDPRGFHQIKKWMLESVEKNVPSIPLLIIFPFMPVDLVIVLLGYVFESLGRKGFRERGGEKKKKGRIVLQLE